MMARTCSEKALSNADNRYPFLTRLLTIRGKSMDVLQTGLIVKMLRTMGKKSKEVNIVET